MLDLRPMQRPDIGLPVRHPSTQDSEALAVLILIAALAEKVAARLVARSVKQLPDVPRP